MANPNFRYPIRQAVTWRIIAELFHRHHGRRLTRLLETHPCSGQYDCLAMFSQNSEKHLQYLGAFNYCNHLHNAAGLTEAFSAPDRADFVWAYLSAENPKQTVDEAERLLGLPHVEHGRQPPATH